jgi:hypothetical protein
MTSVESVVAVTPVLTASEFRLERQSVINVMFVMGSTHALAATTFLSAERHMMCAVSVEVLMLV